MFPILLVASLTVFACASLPLSIYSFRPFLFFILSLLHFSAFFLLFFLFLTV
ncbi:hypothetical protein BC940DRAFT_176417 [Gongronella butleri]|nr:hypothetical protein BC940DRAFT_176417 [Gongronella butleri]